MSNEQISVRLLTGQCLCGAVEYQVSDAFDYALNCHCSLCRRSTGAAFKPFGGIAGDQLSLVRGADILLIYGSDAAHDVHCRICGSLLYSMLDHGAKVHVTYGTLLQSPSLQPTAHIFVGSKASWHVIADGLPQHEEFPMSDE